MGKPCVSVPGHANDAGLPVGVQVIAPFGRDALALAAAQFRRARARRQGLAGADYPQAGGGLFPVRAQEVNGNARRLSNGACGAQR